MLYTHGRLHIQRIASVWRKNMLGYLSADIRDFKIPVSHER